MLCVAELTLGCAAGHSGEVPKELQGLVTAAYYAWLVRYTVFCVLPAANLGLCILCLKACCSHA